MECNLFESEYPRCCCSVAQLCLILHDPIDCSTPGFPVLHHLQSLLNMSIESVMPSNHLILCHPLLLPSILPIIRVFSNDSALHTKWPKSWIYFWLKRRTWVERFKHVYTDAVHIQVNILKQSPRFVMRSYLSWCLKLRCFPGQPPFMFLHMVSSSLPTSILRAPSSCSSWILTSNPNLL